MGARSLAPQAVAEQLLDLAPRRVLVAFSGGRDSTVLLDLLAAGPLRPLLAAIHCDHGIHPESAKWAARAVEAAGALGVPCELLRLALSPRPEAGLEAEARAARYAAIAGRMRAGDVLVTAHHADDQAETFLLMALRGSGPAGLAAMPAVAELGAGRHARPLLAWTRADIASWAQSRQLVWTEDPSNVDLARDRNRIRQLVLPALEARWPAAVRSLARAAALSNEARGLLEALADLDLAAHLDPTAPQRLPTAALDGLDAPRARNALRRWFAGLELPAPPRYVLTRVLGEMLPARSDRMPRITWRGAWVARYAGCLHAGPTLPPAPKPTERWAFEPGQMLALPAGGALSLEPARGEGLAAALVAAAPVEVRYRHGTESIRAAGEDHHRTLKKLLATQRVAPWMRARLPLIYVGGELAAVADLVVAEGFAAAADAAGLRVVWRGHPPLN